MKQANTEDIATTHVVIVRTKILVTSYQEYVIIGDVLGRTFTLHYVLVSKLSRMFTITDFKIRLIVIKVTQGSIFYQPTS